MESAKSKKPGEREDAGCEEGLETGLVELTTRRYWSCVAAEKAGQVQAVGLHGWHSCEGVSGARKLMLYRERCGLRCLKELFLSWWLMAVAR